MLDKIPPLIDFSFWNDTLWCLFDAKSKSFMDLHSLPYDYCTFILSTYPRPELVKDFKNSPAPQVFYMPTWTEAELKVIAPSFPAVASWEERFRILGGIPRHVLEVKTDNPIKILQDECSDWDLIDCINRIDLDSVHSLAHITSTNPFSQSSVTFASKTALDIIVENKSYEVKLKLPELLHSCERNPVTGATDVHAIYAIDEHSISHKMNE
jgi:hypothetical protein